MFAVDVMSRTPVYEQILEQVERFVATGVLKAGDALPSVRNLSVELSCNPNTIQKAFNELGNSGIIISVPGKGSFISGDALSVISKKSMARMGDFKLLAKQLLLAGCSTDELAKAVSEAATELAALNLTDKGGDKK